MFTYIIKPQQISRQTIRTEIANTLHIAVARIRRFEYWPHQLWVHIEGVGGRIMSYRSLPTYDIAMLKALALQPRDENEGSARVKRF